MENKSDVVTYEETQKILASNSKSVLVDVRSKEDYEKGHIPSAINLPYTEFEEAIQLPKHEFYEKYGFEYVTPEAHDSTETDSNESPKVILHCGGGTKCRRAATVAEKFGRSGSTLVYHDGYKGYVKNYQ
ncbi:Thiosulfate sulfurtransferase/rhodanese-like domain-containing protein 3 [Smittium mucronatum]|uniref:Thiosulfate sulfurtransferase/rhodanese-like domain-containing protein 3 n=1 Tax=Smittium mucronatum TaxID=133383 RepID=A0A1R0H209_9FUNG|nr:Thiosulfate sulfurtransferase/rhodanese-like domain-containing protein 3 [Smittium mucronatum]